MTDERQTCSKCGKARKQEKHGSITQWITTCSCLAPEEAELANIEVVPVCQRCGKRVSAGRSGSFTQWVFRSDICACDKPELFEGTTTGGDVGHGRGTRGSDNLGVIAPRLANDRSGVDDSPEDDDPEELEVNPGAFPSDRYKPIAHLDKGASGVVYLSRDRLLGTKVAVKCLRALSAEQLIAFQNEARATSKMNHENIVKVLNFGGTEFGAPYMVMEYIDGITLQAFVERHGPLPLPLAIDIFQQICAALVYAHEKDIFHRDLKTSNIMLVQRGGNIRNLSTTCDRPSADQSGGVSLDAIRDLNSLDLHACLIDFGVAMVKHATMEPTIIQGNTVVGTPSYMPPDQSRGRTYDQRSEIYALGCVMFEALSGAVPFKAETAMEVISMHASKPAPLLSEVNEQVNYGKEIEAIVSKCLEKEPESRFQSVEELSNALAALGDSIAEYRRRTGELETPSVDKMKSGVSKTKMLVIGVICTCVLACGAFALWHIWHHEINPPTTKKRLTKRQKREKEFEEKFVIIYEPRLTTVESKISITDDDLRLITAIKPREGTELAVELKNSPALTGKKFKNLPARTGALDFYSSGVTDDGLKNLGLRPDLKQLGMVRTSISKEGLQYLSLPALRVLDLSYCGKLDDDSVKLIVEKWPNLEFLALAETGITSHSVKYIAHLTRLRTLCLNGTPVTNANIEALSQLPMLQDLGITNTEVTDEGLEYLVKMPQLRILGLVGSLNIKEPAILDFMKRRPDVTVRGRRKQEVEDLYFSSE